MKRLISFFALSGLMLIGSADSRAAWINDRAPAFEASTLDGAKVSVEPGGPITFLNFWASWCPPCKEEFPKLNKLAGDYKGKNVRVVAVTLDKALANVHKFLEKNGAGNIHLQLLRDPEGKSAAKYSARAMPMSFVIDAKGVVRFVHMGFQADDEAKWRKELDILLAEGGK